MNQTCIDCGALLLPLGMANSLMRSYPLFCPACAYARTAHLDTATEGTYLPPAIPDETSGEADAPTQISQVLVAYGCAECGAPIVPPLTQGSPAAIAKSSLCTICYQLAMLPEQPQQEAAPKRFRLMGRRMVGSLMAGLSRMTHAQRMALHNLRCALDEGRYSDYPGSLSDAFQHEPAKYNAVQQAEVIILDAFQADEEWDRWDRWQQGGFGE